MEITLISKQQAQTDYCNGKAIAIGYRNKEDGAFWFSDNFKECVDQKTCNTIEGFNRIRKKVKEYIPHTRIKYGKIEN